MIFNLLEKNVIPDFLIRIGIRRLLLARLKDENKGSRDCSHNENTDAPHMTTTCCSAPLTLPPHLEVVVVGVLGQAAVHEGPGQVVHRVLQGQRAGAASCAASASRLKW
jgi:hypothetical protein